MTLPCLYTVVKNMAGLAMFFGFLPPHGVNLDDGEELAVPGDLTTRIASAKDSGRSFPSYEAALDATEIVIISSPSVFLYDSTIDAVKQLRLNNNTLGIIEPCWGYFSESGGTSHAGD